MRRLASVVLIFCLALTSAMGATKKKRRSAKGKRAAYVNKYAASSKSAPKGCPEPTPAKQAAKHEPAKHEPAKHEPTKHEAAKQEPAKPEPAKKDAHAKADPHAKPAADAHGKKDAHAAPAKKDDGHKQVAAKH
jgi:hypothetical protein